VLKHTPFHERTSALCLGQNWRRWAGHLVASSYDLVHEREYHAIRSSAALIDISPLYKYHVSGRDAARLLDRVVTRDIAAMAVGQVVYTSWCDADGKVIDDGTVSRLEEQKFRLTSADPQVQPLLDYRHLTDPLDTERLRKAIRLALRLTAHPALQDLLRERVSPTDADLASDQALDDWLHRNIGTSHHICGTCKMGPASDPMAVVDQYGRVHGLQNLRIADASIMPDCIRANTNATTIMIGERIADFLRQGR